MASCYIVLSCIVLHVVGMHVILAMADESGNECQNSCEVCREVEPAFLSVYGINGLGACIQKCKDMMDTGSLFDCNQDECIGEGSGNNCDTNAQCTDTEGGFECECKAGWAGNGVTCTDEDECIGEGSGNNCDTNAKCTNIEGGYDCACKAGWTGNGVTCTLDQDECIGEGSGNNCDTNAQCTDTEGGFECECKAGWAGNGVACTDEDECIGEGSGNDCSDTTQCTNTAGGFKCECKAGWVSDGVNCFEKLGMEDFTIPDANIYSPSEYWPATDARLNDNRDDNWGWYAKIYASASVVWIQVDIGYQTDVHGVIMQGSGHSGGWITLFEVSTFSQTTSDIEEYITDDMGVTKEFATGATDTFEARTVVFPSPVSARIVRIHPTRDSLGNKASDSDAHHFILRFDLFGVRQAA